MPTPTIAQVLAGAGELSALPDTWQRLDVVLARSASTTSQIAEILGSDPMLSARLLRLANSPMFGLSQQVEQLSQAVHLIGTRQLRELALAAIVVDRLASGGRASTARFLDHSLAAGLFARAIAARRRESNIERFFVAGLLHDLGLFVLQQAYPDEAAACQRDALSRQIPIESAEHERLGFDHAAIGAALMDNWRLPPALREPVAWHHQPALAPTHRVEAAAIHVSALAIDLIGFGGEGVVTTPLDPRAWELLGLEANELPAIAIETANAIVPMLSALGADAV